MTPQAVRYLIRLVLNCDGHDEIRKIRYIVHCINDEDWAYRQEIIKIVRSEFPQYRKVLADPDKYKILF